MVHLSKLCCYSNRWLWVRLNFADVFKMERYPLLSFFLFLGQKLTIVEQSCTGSFFIDFLPCSDCQIPKLFTKLFSILQDLNLIATSSMVPPKGQIGIFVLYFHYVKDIKFIPVYNITHELITMKMNNKSSDM